MLQLIPVTDSRLRADATTVSNPVQEAKLATQLLATMAAEGGVGLAAPQVGKSIRMFTTGVEGHGLVFINPQIEWLADKEIWWNEGCLSLPRLHGDVQRPEAVRVRAFDEQGKERVIVAEGLLARVIQHETDHLDGILFTDHAKLSTVKEMTEEEWQSRFDENQDRHAVEAE